MSERDIIHNYLKSLSKYLSRLEKAAADDVIREIESHIHDALEAAGDDSQVSTILDGFGAPRELAAAYVEHMLEGTPPPAGFRAIQSVKKGATKGLYYSTGFIGYLFAAAFFGLAVAKPFAPDKIGVWVAEHGQSIVIGAVSEMPAGTEEMLGWWAVPVGLILAAATTYMTKRILGIMKLNA